MLLTPHVLVGITIATAIPNPAVAVPLSFAMHFFGDLVPHWDFFSHTTREQKLSGWRIPAVMADFGLGIAVGIFFTLQALWVQHNSSLALNIFLCSLASVLPDALEAPHLYLGANDFFSRNLIAIQRRMQFQARLPWGVISQLLIASVCLVLLSNSILRV